MKIGCCIGIEYYDILAKLGFDSITLAGVDVVAWSEEQFVSVLTKMQSGALQSISINSFCPAALRLTGSNADTVEIRNYTRKLCARAERMGVRYIGIGAPKSRNVDRDNTYALAWKQLQAAFTVICEEAVRVGIDVLLEPVCKLECNLINTMQEALRFLEEMQLPNLHLVYDIYHEDAESQPLSVIAEAGDEIRVVHIAQNVNNERCYLDPAYTEKYRAYWDALQKIGYQGEYNLEAMVGNPCYELPRSYRILKEL